VNVIDPAYQTNLYCLVFKLKNEKQIETYLFYVFAKFRHAPLLKLYVAATSLLPDSLS
jgi:hypothetical protein